MIIDAWSLIWVYEGEGGGGNFTPPPVGLPLVTQKR